jgi:hypothetical protein
MNNKITKIQILTIFIIGNILGLLLYSTVINLVYRVFANLLSSWLFIGMVFLVSLLILFVITRFVKNSILDSSEFNKKIFFLSSELLLSGFVSPYLIMIVVGVPLIGAFFSLFR